MRPRVAFAISALPAALILGGCSHAQPPASAASMPPGCTDVISAIGSYATMSFSADKTGNWAAGLASAMDGPVASLSQRQQAGVTDLPRQEQLLLAQENAVLNEASALADDAAGSPGQVPDDLTYIRNYIAQIYAACGQRMPLRQSWPG